MYQDTPRDHIGTVYETLMFGDNPLGWEIARHEGDDQGREPRHVHSTTSTSGTRPTAWSSASAGMVGADLDPDARGAARRHAAATATADRRPAQLDRPPGPRVAVHHKDAEQAHLILGVPELSRSTIPTATRSRCSRRCSARACRRASSSRCASAAASPTTSTARTTPTPTQARCYAQAGVDIKRIDEAIKVIVEQFDADGRARRSARRSSRSRARSSRAGSSCAPRARRG